MLLVALLLVGAFALKSAFQAPSPVRQRYTDDCLREILKLKPIEDFYPVKEASEARYPDSERLKLTDDFYAGKETPKPAGMYPARRNIAIIGSGAFGTSLAYFLHQLVPSTDVTVTVFDKLNRPGGRVRAMGIYDPCTSLPTTVEIGASIFVEGNKYLMNLTEKMGLERKNETDYPVNPPGTRAIGLWNGAEFLYSFSGGFWTGPAAFLRWGFSIMNGKSLAAETEAKWSEVYAMMARGEYSGSPGALLKKLEGLDELVTGAPARETLANLKLADRYLDEFVEPTTLVNYFQPLKRLNTLAALVSLTAAYTPTHSIRGGNFQLFEELLLASNSGWVKGSQIVEIKATKGRGKAKYTLVDSEGREWPDYDDVVLAGPLVGFFFVQYFVPTLNFLSRTQQSLNISLPSDAPPPFFPHEYVTVFVTIVTGVLDPAYFGLPADAQPPLDVIVPRETTNPVPFRSISVVHRFPCLTPTNNITVTKIFSETAPSTADLLKIYSKVYDLQRFSWPAAYPYLDPFKSGDEIPGYGPYGDGLWFGAGFEAAFSCMEGEIVSARNLAGLLAETMVRK
jgi:prenylcysteine oxidase/farnesylcysteine lyase